MGVTEKQRKILVAMTGSDTKTAAEKAGTTIVNIYTSNSLV